MGWKKYWIKSGIKPSVSRIPCESLVTKPPVHLPSVQSFNFLVWGAFEILHTCVPIYNGDAYWALSNIHNILHMAAIFLLSDLWSLKIFLIWQTFFFLSFMQTTHMHTYTQCTCLTYIHTYINAFNIQHVNKVYRFCSTPPKPATTTTTKRPKCDRISSDEPAILKKRVSVVEEDCGQYG